MLLTHKPCGEKLTGEVRCSACGETLRARDVQFAFDS